ncbi:MAG: hypothetical protein ABIY39_03355 [Sphingomonas sp.]
MDLSYRFDRSAMDRAAVTAIPTELAVLMVGVAARQAASPTARLQSGIARLPAPQGLFAPTHGAFNREVELALALAAEAPAAPEAALPGRQDT